MVGGIFRVGFIICSCCGPFVILPHLGNAVVYLEYIIFSRELPDGNKDFILRSLGMLEGMVMLVFAFCFGSSRGSDRLKDILKKE